MTSLTPSFRRVVAIAIAAAAIGLSATACSAIPTATGHGSTSNSAPSGHASDSGSAAGSTSGGGSAGSNSGLCADATGEGFAFDPQSSDMTKALQTWDRMVADAPADIRDAVAGVDKVLHKVSTGDASAVTAAFGDQVAAVGTWVAKNCNL